MDGNDRNLFERRLDMMCYLIARYCNSIGCVAVRTPHGPPLIAMKKKLIGMIGFESVELITISRPMAYLEYSPYNVVATEDKFIHSVVRLYESVKERGNYQHT